MREPLSICSNETGGRHAGLPSRSGEPDVDRIAKDYTINADNRNSRRAYTGVARAFPHWHEGLVTWYAWVVSNRWIST
jgi:hypothetical protein